jgi:hypothetical protein
MPEMTPADSLPEEGRPAETRVEMIHLGDAVRLRLPPRYLKTADPMPMLRPPDLVDPGEVGRVVEIRALDLRAVRFRRGTFLINASDLEPVPPGG